MIVYLGMVLLTLIIAHFMPSMRACERNVRRTSFFSVKKRSLFFLLLMLPSVLVSGLRYYVGTDYTTYLGRYHCIGSVFANRPRSMEPLYRVVVEIGHFFNSQQLVFFITAFLFSFFIYKFLVDNSDNIKFGAFLVFFTGAFSLSENIMRQMVGVSICLFATKYIFSNELKKYLFFVLLATLFHYMSVIYAPLFFLNRLDILFKKKFLLLFFGGFFLCAKILYSFIIWLLMFLGSDYINYYGSTRDTGSSTAVTALSVFVFLFCFVFISPKSEKYRQNMFMTMLVCLACLELFLGLPNANRLAFVFLPVQIILVPNVIAEMKRPVIKRLALLGLCVLYIVFWYYYFYYLNIGETFPYQSVLSVL